MGKGSKQRPTDKAAFDDNFDRIFGRGRRDEEDRVLHWCSNCEAGRTKGQVVKMIHKESNSSRAREDLACKLCGFPSIEKYEFQDLSPSEKQYLN
tara:strand:+ start:127 stop:411 length:285 start_codon:yes stop_codon:yes gene_type:complete